MSVGRDFGRTLKGGDVVALIGTLGAGKTCFVKGVCESQGIRTHVGSPTFTLINEYSGAGISVVHIDLYRLTETRELNDLGVLEYFTGDRICLIEWPGLVLRLLPADHYTVEIRHGARETERIISIDGGPG